MACVLKNNFFCFFKIKLIVMYLCCICSYDTSLTIVNPYVISTVCYLNELNFLNVVYCCDNLNLLYSYNLNSICKRNSYVFPTRKSVIETYPFARKIIVQGILLYVCHHTSPYRLHTMQLQQGSRPCLHSIPICK